MHLSTAAEESDSSKLNGTMCPLSSFALNKITTDSVHSSKAQPKKFNKKEEYFSQMQTKEKKDKKVWGGGQGRELKVKLTIMKE